MLLATKSRIAQYYFYTSRRPILHPFLKNATIVSVFAKYQVIQLVHIAF